MNALLLKRLLAVAIILLVLAGAAAYLLLGTSSGPTVTFTDKKLTLTYTPSKAATDLTLYNMTGRDLSTLSISGAAYQLTLSRCDQNFKNCTQIYTGSPTSTILPPTRTPVTNNGTKEYLKLSFSEQPAPLTFTVS